MASASAPKKFAREVTLQSSRDAAPRSAQVSCVQTAPDTLTFEMDGAADVVRWAEVEPGVYAFLVGNRSIEVSVRSQPANRENGRRQYVVSTRGRSIFAEVRDSRSRRRNEAGAAGDAPLDVAAPMPGRVARLQVSEGAQVAKGDGLVVIEAMKMQNELRAARAGTIEKVYVKEGEGVEMAALLMRLK